MANAKKCDRCGNYYQESEPNAFESLSNYFSGMVSQSEVLHRIAVIEKCLDLCPACSKSLKRWMKLKEDTADETENC